MKAVVLAAGRGTRLGELTRELPKPMLPVAGRPLLEHILLNLRRNGFDEIAVNLHYRPDAIRSYFGDGSKLGIRIAYLEEPQLLGTAGTVAALRDFFGGEPFLAHYGDVVTNHDFSAMADFHATRGALLTLLVHERAGSNSVVVLDAEQRISAFHERPPADHPSRLQSSWVNSAVYMCAPSILEFLPSAPSDLARDVVPKLAGRSDVYGFPLDGFRVAVDSAERYREAEERLLAAS